MTNPSFWLYLSPKSFVFLPQPREEKKEVNSHNTRSNISNVIFYWQNCTRFDI